MSKISKILIILLFSSNIYAQKKLNFFENVNFGKNFISELRNTQTKIEVGYLNKLDDNYYNKNFQKRPFVESHLAYDLNILSYSSKKYNFAISLPGGAVTLTDLFEEKTAPVINTDYWFGTQFKFISYPFKDNNFLKNISVNLFPIFHESTHIGDEFSLHGYKNIPDFKRINISYEAWKFDLTINDPDTLKGNVLSFKTGFQNLWTIKDGYYFADSLEVKGVKVPQSTKTAEYFFVLNYQRTKGLLANKKWVNIFSVEAKNSIRFSYDENTPDTRAWSYNFYFGWIYKKSNKPFRNVGFFIRHYSGTNPHGQFRNSGGFKYTAFSISLI